MNRIIIFDVLLMIAIILFPYQFNGIISIRKDHHDIFLILTFMYIVIKSIFGIYFIANKIKNKHYMLYSKKYLLLLLPVILLSLLYTFYISFLFITDISYYIFKIYIHLFFLTVFSLILCILFMTGFSMWQINWTFYEIKIKRYILVIYNIVTFICISKLIFELIPRFMG